MICKTTIGREHPSSVRRLAKAISGLSFYDANEQSSTVTGSKSRRHAIAYGDASMMIGRGPRNRGERSNISNFYRRPKAAAVITLARLVWYCLKENRYAIFTRLSCRACFIGEIYMMVVHYFVDVSMTIPLTAGLFVRMPIRETT